MTGTATTIPRVLKPPASRDQSHLAACKIEPLGEDRHRDWDAYVLARDGGTLFHTLGWRRAVAETFGHEPIYLIALRGDQLVGVLPMFLVKSRLAGRLLVSVPYAVGGGMVADDDEIASALFEKARSTAEERNCISIDLRSEHAIIPSLRLNDRYVGFARALPATPDQVLGTLPRKARAAARNAREKYKLEVSYDDRNLAQVWQLYAISMKRIGSIIYPYSFFLKLIEHTSGRHWISLVKWEGRPVAGLVTFLFKDTVMPYFFGTTAAAKKCSAANFAYLTTMERGVAAGYRQFDFGRSRRDNTGSFNFKRFQGFEPRPLGYQMWTAPGHEPPDLTPDNPKFRLARRVWRYLPLCVSKRVSAWAAIHIPG